MRSDVEARLRELEYRSYTLHRALVDLADGLGQLDQWALYIRIAATITTGCAQGATITLSGCAAGAGAGATVTLTLAGIGTVLTAVTDGAGRAVFASLAPGSWTVAVALAGGSLYRTPPSATLVVVCNTAAAQAKTLAWTWVKLVQRSGGAAVPGATVVASLGGTVIETRTTGSDGVATFTVVAPGTAYSLAITIDGFTQTFPGVVLQCGATYDYCKATIAVTTTPAGAALAPSALALGAGWALAGGVYTFHEIALPAVASALPRTITIMASSAGYLDHCKTVTVHCGDALTVTLAGYHYDPAYIQFGGCAVCAPDCATGDVGPDNQCLVPKVLKFRLNTTYTGPGSPGADAVRDLAWFGPDGGVWLSLPYSVGGSGQGQWLRACQAASLAGQIVCTGGGLPASYQTVLSTRIESDCLDVGGLGSPGLIYRRFASGDCSTPTTVGGQSCAADSVFFPIPDVGFYSPVAETVSGGSAPSGSGVVFSLDIAE